MKIFFQSFGCDKNRVDTEHMLYLLREAGYEFTDDETNADIAILNTCCFIGDAKKESIEEILRLATLKESASLKSLIVTGCLSERYSRDFYEALPEVDGILGISAWDSIVSVVKKALKGEKPAVFQDKNRLCTVSGRVLSTEGYYAYLKIAEGCDKRCTYCVIPSVRGGYRSVPKETLLKEARELVAMGVKELILVAQETTVYGLDLYGKKALPELLRELAAIDGIEWIRLLYCYPEEITDELVETVKTVPKIVKYLDLPIQHASDRVLKRMNRKTTRKEIKERIRFIRKEIPNITLRTTMITGFPGETEKDFEELRSFVKSMHFDRLGVFAYSKEDGTPAAKLKEQVPKRIKEKRRNEIMKLQAEISLKNGLKKVGKKVRALVVGSLSDEPDCYVLRTEGDAPEVDGFLFVRSPLPLCSGDFVNVRITGANEYDLTGELLS